MSACRTARTYAKNGRASCRKTRTLGGERKQAQLRQSIEYANEIFGGSVIGFKTDKPSLQRVAFALRDKTADEVEDLCKNTPLFDLLEDRDVSKLVIEHLATLKYPDDKFEENTGK